MIQYVLITLAALTLADRLGPHSQSTSTTATSANEPSSDPYAIVYQMKEALRNEENDQSNRMAYNPVPDTVKTCFINDMRGECMQSWLCDDNNTIIKPVVEFRDADTGECSDSLMKCCLQRKKAIPTPEIPQGCGWTNPEGVGFKITPRDGETNFAEFPWTIALHKKSNFVIAVGDLPQYAYIGGGSLIHRQVVLTAAHYVVGEPADAFMVRAGEWDFKSKSEPYVNQDRTVQKVVAHPNYNVNGVYDVSLLFLASPVQLAPNVGLACLPPAGVRAAAHARCIATGWGKKQKENMDLAQILKRVEVPVVDRGQCQNKLRSSVLGRNYVLDDSVMCAGGDGLDTCKGDGGAPLVCPSSTPNRYIQHGIVSWGIGCHNYPGVYSDVGFLRGWIDDTVRNRGFNPSVYSLDDNTGSHDIYVPDSDLRSGSL